MKYITTLLAAFLLCFSVNAKEITLSADNTLIFDSPFTDSSVAELMEQATKLDANLKSGYPIYLFLHTPGGSIQAGLELYEFFNGINRPVHTITLFAASMGFQTVQHLGKRYILKYGVLMAHKARGGFRGEFGDGISQLDSRYGMWLRRIDMMDKLTVKRTGGKQTLKTYRASYDNEMWLNGPEAVKKGYADEVVTVKCDLSMQGFREAEKNYGFFKVSAKFSKCPLKMAPVKVSTQILTNKGEMDFKEFLLKNGKFGKKCRDYPTAPRKDYFGEVIPPKAPELCARDTELTIEKIMKAMGETKKFYNRDLRYHVKYSY